MASDWENLGWFLRSYSPTFFFSCLETTEPISLVFTFAEMFTILKGLEMFSNPAIPVRSSLLQGSLTCFGVTVRSSVLKLY